MKRVLSILLAAGFAGFASAGAAEAREAAPAHPVAVVVGFDADFPPYGYKDGSAYKGFDLDLARAVCAAKGWTFVANPIN